MKKNLFFFSLVSMLCSCVSSYQIENISPEQPVEARARITIVRSSVIGMVNYASIYASNNFVGKLGPASYLSWNVDPGTVVLECNKNYFKVNAKPDGNYYILLTPKFSFLPEKAKYQFHPLSQEEGERKVVRLSKPSVKNS